MSQSGIISLAGGGGGGVVNSVTGTNGVTASTIAGAVTVSGVNATTTTVGVASFNAAEFTVTAGAVSLIGGSAAITSITGDTGGPEVPLTGNFNLKGTANQVLVTGSANTETFSLIGPYTPATYTAHGVLVGEGTSSIVATAAGTTGQVFTGVTGADPIWASPAASTITLTGTTGGALGPSNSFTLLGGTVAAGTVPVAIAGSGTTLKTNVQISQALAATDVTKIGLANFNSTNFTVDANGFVSLAATAAPILSITGNTGGPEIPNPVNGTFNIVGTGSITVAGSANTETVQLTGLTANSVLYGLGTATIGLVASGTTGQVLQTNTGAAPTYSTATYPSTTTINQILFSSATNTVTGLATANNGVLTTGTTGIPVITALASNGQIIIGSGSGAPIAATLTPGTGVTITNAANSITISATGGSFAWVDATSATQAISIQTGFVTDHSATVVYTLPATAALGDQFRIVGKLGLATITPNAGQQLLIGSASGTVGVTGTAVSQNVGDCIWFVAITAGSSTVWRAESMIGTWILT